MKITKTTEGRHTTLSVAGTINTDTALALSEALIALDYRDLDLTMDFRQTEYITSAGLRALLVARKSSLTTPCGSSTPTRAFARSSP